MKAEELMIGDWVKLKDAQLGYIKFNGPTVKIESIVPPNVYVRNYKGLLEDVKDEYLLPIPLNPEILESNFKEYLPGINLMYKLKGPYMAMNEDGEWVFGLVKEAGADSIRFPLVKTTYVHQLQQALRLCRIEKEIEL